MDTLQNTILWKKSQRCSFFGDLRVHENSQHSRGKRVLFVFSYFRFKWYLSSLFKKIFQKRKENEIYKAIPSSSLVVEIYQTRVLFSRFPLYKRALAFHEEKRSVYSPLASQPIASFSHREPMRKEALLPLVEKFYLKSALLFPVLCAICIEQLDGEKRLRLVKIAA